MAKEIRQFPMISNKERSNTTSSERSSKDKLAADLDAKMRQILTNKELDAGMRVILYTDILKKYKKLQPKEKCATSENEDLYNPKINEILTVDLLSNRFSKNVRLNKSAKRILQQLFECGFVEINRDLNIVLNGEILTNSNIYAILTYLLRPRKNMKPPSGIFKIMRWLPKRFHAKLSLRKH